MGRWLRRGVLVGAIALLAPGACTSGPGLEPPAQDNTGAGGQRGVNDMMGGGLTGSPNDFGNSPGAMGGAAGAVAGPQPSGNQDVGERTDAGAIDGDADASVEAPDGGTP